MWTFTFISRSVIIMTLFRTVKLSFVHARVSVKNFDLWVFFVPSYFTLSVSILCLSVSLSLPFECSFFLTNAVSKFASKCMTCTYSMITVQFLIASYKQFYFFPFFRLYPRFLELQRVIPLSMWASIRIYDISWFFFLKCYIVNVL